MIALTPALPYLLKAGEEAGKEAAKKLGADGWEKAKELWGKLRPAVEAKPLAAGAADEAAAAPEDTDAVAAFRLQLRKILGADEDLAAALQQLLGPATGASYHAEVHGEGAIGLGEGAVTAGAGGLAIGKVEGDVHVADPAGRQEAGPRGLGAYLRYVVRQTGKLSLSGVDPAVAGREAETRLDLDALYTALLTLSARDRQHATAAEPEAFGRPQGGEERRSSALEALDRHRHLVLLGDPGSGKTTFVAFVALCLAGELLGREDANVEQLTAPLPQDDGGDGEERQPWRHGPLVPVRVVLRDFAARGLPAGDRASAGDLWRFVAAELDAAGLGEVAPRLKDELLERGGLLLLDGLDEVPEAEERRADIRRVVDSLCEGFGLCRVLVTSRTHAYQNQGWRLPGFEEAILAPWSDGQIRRFVRRWYAHVASLQKLRAEVAEGRARLLERAIFASDRLRFLAERPLLLTLMASLHSWRGGSLPERREKLYADTVDLLLDFWERQRIGGDERGEPVLLQPGLAEWLKVDREKVRQALDELAYEAHARQEELQGTADLPEGEVVARLMRLRDRPEGNPATLVDYLSQRAGILEPRGVGVYSFPHRTFQEYLAACHLTGDTFPDELAELARRDPDRWREAALLAAAKAARGSRAAVWSLADALCFREPGDAEGGLADLWGAQLAAQALVESADLADVSERHEPKVERLRGWLLRLMRGSELPARERALAGDSLAALGDPRFNPEAWHLPAEPSLGFVEIEAGLFLMGSDRPDDSWTGSKEAAPQHSLRLPAFYLARHPVTVAQFAAFVEDSGYADPDPRALEDPANRPVRYVSWRDAVAYCEWLSGKLRRQAVERQGDSDSPAAEALWRRLAAGELVVGLPSEAQWEKAARGADGRIYPWGNDPEPERASYDETGIGDTSAVGCFPGGASPYGCEEMSGNVWEWTRSLWGSEWRKPEFGYPYVPTDGREDMSREKERLRVVRGGAFGSSRGDVRCAYRFGGGPLARWLGVGFRVALSPFSLSSEASDL